VVGVKLYTKARGGVEHRCQAFGTAADAQNPPILLMSVAVADPSVERDHLREGLEHRAFGLPLKRNEDRANAVEAMELFLVGVVACCRCAKLYASEGQLLGRLSEQLYDDATALFRI
jgi:hypothetical protein